jgi:hypothetical protein
MAEHIGAALQQRPHPAAPLAAFRVFRETGTKILIYTKKLKKGTGC